MRHLCDLSCRASKRSDIEPTIYHSSWGQTRVSERLVPKASFQRPDEPGPAPRSTFDQGLHQDPQQRRHRAVRPLHDAVALWMVGCGKVVLGLRTDFRSWSATVVVVVVVLRPQRLLWATARRRPPTRRGGEC